MTTRARITTVNLNGIRAAARKGLLEWLDTERPDVLLMQEVRAPEELTAEILGEGWQVHTVACRIKGRAGVAVAVRKDAGMIEAGSVRTVLDDAETDADSGRWVEAHVRLGDAAPLRVVSAYFHSGEVGTPKQEAKMAHLPRIGERMGVLLREADTGVQSLVAGDFNVVRSRADIKNWTPNHNKRAGVLDEEIAFLDAWVEAGWHDVSRDLSGEAQGPYTWWSWRGQAFDNDAGWRIDYHYVTPGLAEVARKAEVGRAASYDQRFSDHAPLTVTYDLA